MAIATDTADRSNGAASHPVTFAHHVPEKPLSEFVGLFWYWQGHEVPYSKERVLPDGGAELVIKLESYRTSDSGISGARSESLVIKRTSQDELLGVHFKSGGAFPFLGFPFGELHNLGMTLADLWGERRADRLLCLLHEAATVEMKFQILEKWLLQVAGRTLKHHPAVAFAIREFQRNPGLLTSAEVAEKVGYSQRRFIELFRDEVGLTPKLFCRVRRFQEVLHTIHKESAVDWPDVAVSFGYSDQSHFIHDFREFSGLSPTEYFRLRTEHIGHVQFPG